MSKLERLRITAVLAAAITTLFSVVMFYTAVVLPAQNVWTIENRKIYNVHISAPLDLPSLQRQLNETIATNVSPTTRFVITNDSVEVDGHPDASRWQSTQSVSNTVTAIKPRVILIPKTIYKERSNSKVNSPPQPSATINDPSTATISDHSTATISDHSTATISDHSTATISDHSTATISDHSTATISDHSTATISDHSTATISDHSTATISDHSTATISDHSTATISDHSTATISDPSTATISDHSTATISEHSTATISEHSTATISDHSTVSVQNNVLNTKSDTYNTNCADHICLQYLSLVDKARYQSCSRATPNPHTVGNCHFMDGRHRQAVALASYPGSGNTWVRGLLEAATGICTGAIYCDMSLRDRGFLGEKVQGGSVLVVKTHGSVSLWTGVNTKKFDKRTHFSSAIFIVRNPLDAMVAEWNRRVANNFRGRTVKLDSHVKSAGRQWFGKLVNPSVICKS